MSITQAQAQAAEAVQHAAAHDYRPLIRLVAGPGTGKSAAIEERIRWLLDQGVPPDSIYAVSFTRAAAIDLRNRIYDYCDRKGYAVGRKIRVSTLHSLALQTLRTAGQLHFYPAEPKVLDNWELENIFDAEFGDAYRINSKVKCANIRLEHEAFWSTGQWAPPNYATPPIPITVGERAQFDAFHGPRTQTYSCVLPGEIVQKCVAQMEAGILNVVGLLGMEHLVVDEFQDLNPMDLRFVYAAIDQGAKVFVAGDDDQSIYSFRFASPAGIQDFAVTYPNCGQHTLDACFRCTPHVLGAALTLIVANQQPNRIPKNYTSLYQTSTPPLNGALHCWQFASGVAEARAVAESCRDLIASGVNASDILILLSNSRELLPLLEDQFLKAAISYEPPRSESFLDTRTGRLVLALLRIICDTNDYVAHRALLGLRQGVGVGTCNSITNSVVTNNLNYRDIFYHPLPVGVFSGRPLAALNAARSLCAQLQGWSQTDTLGQYLADITTIVDNIFGTVDAQDWQRYANNLPQDIMLSELLDYLWTDTVDQQGEILKSVYIRLNLPIPATGVLQPRVRIMTMHGAKGLSAKVVFVLGLEDAILPGPRRRPYPGLVLEAARLLYVSITRARAACIISYAQYRNIYGRPDRRTPSQFAAQLGSQFVAQTTGLSAVEVQNIVDEIVQL